MTAAAGRGLQPGPLGGFCSGLHNSFSASCQAQLPELQRCWQLTLSREWAGMWAGTPPPNWASWCHHHLAVLRLEPRPSEHGRPPAPLPAAPGAFSLLLSGQRPARGEGAEFRPARDW